jgi:hypothetical protein
VNVKGKGRYKRVQGHQEEVRIKQRARRRLSLGMTGLTLGLIKRIEGEDLKGKANETLLGMREMPLDVNGRQTQDTRRRRSDFELCLDSFVHNMCER